MKALDQLQGRSNYFVGSDAKAWITNIPQYSKIRVGNIYKGIDMVLYGNQQELEYDFVLRPGADVHDIIMDFKGIDKLSVSRDGTLILRTGGRELGLKHPESYQVIDGRHKAIASRYELTGASQVAFQLGAYDIHLPVVIDPKLIYSTYLGGDGEDGSFGIAVGNGHAYITGFTSSSDFPVLNGVQSNVSGGDDVYVSKLDINGDHLIYSTYLGGSNTDSGQAIAVDRFGNAYVAGETFSADFPTVNAIQAVNHGSSNAFIAKLSRNGDSLLYSTYLGGSQFDLAGSIAVDRFGNAYVAGNAGSKDFPVTDALQRNYGGGIEDGFLTKLNATGDTLIYSTFLGGSGDDGGVHVKVDDYGSAYLTGITDSSDFPVKAALQPSNNGGLSDAFVSQVSPDGSSLIFSTYLGGKGSDAGTDLALDRNGNVYVTGTTASADFPVSNISFQSTFGGGEFDAFVAKLSRGGVNLMFSTYLGGNELDLPTGIAVDEECRVFVAGSTTSPNYPITATAIQNQLSGDRDTFVTAFDKSGSLLEFSTLLGGSLSDQVWGLALDRKGDLYVSGTTQSPDFPVTRNALQTTQPGGVNQLDAFVYKIRFGRRHDNREHSQTGDD
jgi:hypothetical protein